MKPKVFLRALLFALRLSLLAGLGFGLGSLSLAPSAWAAETTGLSPQETKRLQDAMNLIAKRLDVQTELPGLKLTPPPPKSEGFWLPLLLKLGFVLVVAFIAVLILISISRHLSRRQERPKPEESAAPLTQRLSQINRDSQRLAQEGHYSAAIHELLLKSLEEFQKRQAKSFAPSLTSREILSRLALGPPVEPALAFLVRQVEVSRFGHYEPRAEDYQACQANFQALVDGLRNPAPA
ncbi:MAG: DUF4129 domain-containing protein [Deltaproteobacteria bacterium]|jgi:Na+-transporting methylmalonyl-CoA/oxaloacetate decarboxylase gamma subunit|nr:DUF4129 domain-containing protein [Deltaproteobacteria bacterium]